MSTAVVTQEAGTVAIVTREAGIEAIFVESPLPPTDVIWTEIATGDTIIWIEVPN